MYLDIIAIVAVSTLFGSMAFFSFVMAPLIFIKLEAATAGRFVRGIFPWYYLVIGVLALLAVVALAAIRPLEAAIMGFVALGALVARQFLMPRINGYRDRMVRGESAAETAFNRLHKFSVWINGCQLVAVLISLILLVLPA